MVGGINASNSSGGSGGDIFIIKFHCIPENATLTVTNNQGEIIEPSLEGIYYKLSRGSYTYSASAPNYQEIINYPFEVADNATIEVKLINIDVYGVRHLVTNTAAACERLEKAVGKTANARAGSSSVTNNFDSIYPWSNIKTCDLLPDGRVAKYYDEPDFSYTNPTGYIMTEFPEFYYNREIKNDYDYMYISASQTEFTPLKSEKFYVGRYLFDADNLNRSGGTIIDGSLSTSSYKSVASKIGTGWTLFDIHHIGIIQLLYLVEFANYNSKSILGISATKGTTKNGLNDNLGMYSGYLGTKGIVNYRGIERIAGYYGMNIIDSLSVTESGSGSVGDFTYTYSWTVKNPSKKLSYSYTMHTSYFNTAYAGTFRLGCDPTYPYLMLPSGRYKSSNVSGSDVSQPGPTGTYMWRYSDDNYLIFSGSTTPDLFGYMFSGINSGSDYLQQRLMYIPQ